MSMLIKTIKLHNLLSFGPDTPELQMRPLNVLIGPNGSGKSNFIEAIGLLQAAPRDLAAAIREGGGIGDWIWRGEPKASTARIEVLVENPKNQEGLHYRLVFGEKGQRFDVTDELIETAKPFDGHENPYIYFAYRNGVPYLNVKDSGQRGMQREDIDAEQSILSQYKDKYHYPELTYLAEVLESIRFYRQWTSGRYAPPRLSQKTSLPNDFLSEDGTNLALLLNRFDFEPRLKSRIRKELRKLYEGVSDFGANIDSGTVQLFLQEGNISMKANRLSDGTLRYLSLLAILCHPQPPPLVCIEEPELGLHPDILPTVADLLREASERCQLVVTTHSDVLVDALTDEPESVVVCEKHCGKTEMRRLDKAALSDWLKDYCLGELWSKGELGGNRW